jgi:uroporphyrinogen-III synthase
MPADPSAWPLAGRTIIVTRSRAQAGALSQALTALGARVIEIPTIAIAPPEDYAPLDAALGRLEAYDWLLVTSANAARVLGERLLPAQTWPRHVGAVGRSTAQALDAAGFGVDLVPEPFVAESLISALAGQVAGKRILLARAAVARDVLPEALRSAGAHVEVVDAYRTVLPDESRELLALAMNAAPDAITFTSSSTVTNFLALLAFADLPRPNALPALSIGPITSATLREHGWPPAGEAAEHDIPGLVAVVLAALGR